jgi:pimeloyl-[acyl-carrier protein] methyl ester esterase
LLRLHKTAPEPPYAMQLGSLTRIFRRDSRNYDGNLFFASVEGRGPDVVFVHGLAASPACWERASELLGPKGRCHFLHIRGFAGEAASPERERGRFLKPLADELAVYLRLHAPRGAMVVGHSMGGIASLVLARDHPQLVSRLMVVDVPAFFSVLITPFATEAAIASLAEASRRRYMRNDPAAFEQGLRQAAVKLAQHPISIERIVHWGLTSDRETTADVMAEVMTTDLRPDLPRILCPTEVIYAWDRTSGGGRMGLDQVYASAYAGLPGRSLQRIDNARHYVMLDQPDLFYRAVRDWLAGEDEAG